MTYLSYLRALMLAASVLAAQSVNAQTAPLDRTVLPIPQPVPEKITEPDGRKAKMPPLVVVKAPKGAPNVVVVLIDGMGFGQPSAFGGPIAMPTFDTSTALPGNIFVPPQNVTPLAEILRQNGYNTAHFGKSHETPAWETSPFGPAPEGEFF